MIEVIILLIQKKYQAHIPCIFAYKVVFIDDRFSKQVVLYGGKNRSQ